MDTRAFNRAIAVSLIIVNLSEVEQNILRMLDDGSSQHEICDALGLDDALYVKVLRDLTHKIDTSDPSTAGDLERALSFERARRGITQAQLHASEARLQALMDISPEGIVVVQGRTGRITQANRVCEEMFGYARHELIGMEVELLLPESKRKLHVKQRLGFLRSIRKREIGYHPPIFALKRDGSEVEVIIGLTSTTATDDVMVICSLVHSPKDK